MMISESLMMISESFEILLAESLCNIIYVGTIIDVNNQSIRPQNFETQISHQHQLSPTLVTSMDLSAKKYRLSEGP